MKRIGVLLVVLALTLPAFARSARRPQLRTLPAGSIHAERMPDARPRAAHLLAQARAAARPAPGTCAIIENRSARALVLPVAGSAAGANGTYFRSDVTFANWNDREQVVGLIWLPNGNPDGIDLFSFVLPATSIVTEQDFVGQFLELSGLGSVIIIPITPEGDLDDDGAIDMYSRIWTPQPNATGTVSQPFPGVEPSFLTFEEEAVILGLRQDAQYRTNFGLLNLSEVDLTFELTVLTEDGGSPAVQTYTVPSMSMIQQGIPAGAFGQLSLGLSLTQVPDEEFTWMAYASSTDNITGDGWVSIAANPWDDERLDEHESEQ